MVMMNKVAHLIDRSAAIPYRLKDETELLALGALLSKQQWSFNSSNLNDYEFKIFSQWGDDGIIQYLIKNVAVANETFIEFGVQNYMESNTRFLMMNNNWSGFVMDGSDIAMNSLKRRSWYWQYSLGHRTVFIDRENINELLFDTNLTNVGLLHIDLDGNDYHILMEIDFERLNPSILILEYNAVFGNHRPISVPYDKKFIRTVAHFSNLYFGASLPALQYGAEIKGYALVGCNQAGNNAYFIRRDLLNERVREVPLEKAFKDSKFREGRLRSYALSYAIGDERYQVIKGMEVFNVVTSQLEKL
jgi:hypothetical protein